MKARCSLCGRDIEYSEHYFITKAMTLCRECGLQFKGNVTKIYNNSELVKERSTKID